VTLGKVISYHPVMAAIDDVRKCIMDEGKRSFNVDDDANGDTDTFYSLYVVPLQNLRDRGVIESLLELRNPQDDAVVRVDIVGGINFELE
jgi:hypothetical protein